MVHSQSLLKWIYLKQGKTFKKRNEKEFPNWPFKGRQSAPFCWREQKGKIARKRGIIQFY